MPSIGLSKRARYWTLPMQQQPLLWKSPFHARNLKPGHSLPSTRYQSYCQIWTTSRIWPLLPLVRERKCHTRQSILLRILLHHPNRTALPQLSCHLHLLQRRRRLGSPDWRLDSSCWTSVIWISLRSLSSRKMRLTFENGQLYKDKRSREGRFYYGSFTTQSTCPQGSWASQPDTKTLQQIRACWTVRH